ncbi:glycosyl transferase family 2 [Betaproteobacteria bacterium]|nr:glycosyl transferase family 2 [Betaproteobacteria bacterium]
MMGSKDDTCAILKRYREEWGERLSLLAGPGKGFAANYLSLTCKSDIQANYYAYADQDDIWEADKLERSIRWLKSIPEDVPALYCSRTRLIDADGKQIGFSPLFSKPPGFLNALVQNIGGGNTMVFNNAARELLRLAGEEISAITHDWWAYQVVTGCGGRVFYDSYPSLRYRQHADNLVGMNNKWSSRFVRIRMMFQGRFKKWNDDHIKALLKLENKLTPKNREILHRFALTREKSLLPRLVGLAKLGIYRQTLLGNLGLIIAAIFKKI